MLCAGRGLNCGKTGIGCWHHDSAPAHASFLSRSYLAKHQTSGVPHPPYFPDLTLADFFLFLKLKTTLKGRRFQTVEGIQQM
jgi:hypothetical protein